MRVYVSVARDRPTPTEIVARVLRELCRVLCGAANTLVFQPAFRFPTHARAPAKLAHYTRTTSARALGATAQRVRRQGMMVLMRYAAAAVALCDKLPCDLDPDPVSELVQYACSRARAFSPMPFGNERPARLKCRHTVPPPARVTKRASAL